MPPVVATFRRHETRIAWVLGLLLAAASIPILVQRLRAFWPFFIDDSFITFRYSMNLAAGAGPTFNVGEARAEGYSSLLWMILMAVPHALHQDAVQFSKVLGIACSVGLAVACFRLCVRLTGFLQGWMLLLPATFTVHVLFSVQNLAVHSVSGMETTFYTLLVMLYLDATTALTLGGGGRSTAWWAIAGLAVGLTRPEGNLIVLGAAAVLLLMNRGRVRLTLVKAILLGYAAPMLAYWAWRWSYYGLFWPLPYYFKVESRETNWAGKKEVLDYLRFWATFFGPLILLGVFKAGRRLLPSITAAVLGIGLFVFPDHAMGFDSRFLYPMTPVLVLASALGIAALLHWAQRACRAPGARRRAFVTVLAVAFFTTGLVWIERGLWHGLATNKAAKHRYAGHEWGVLVPLGKKLEALAANRPVIAVTDAGAIPYYSRWSTIDLVGLNEPHIALTKREDYDYVVSKEPDLVLLNSWSGDTFRPRAPWAPGLHAGFVKLGYQPLMAFEVRPGEYYIWMFGKPDNPRIAALPQLLAPPKGSTTIGSK